MVGSVVLAGGMGSRAWPFCGIRQKVTLPVANVPIITRLIQSLRSSGVTQIVVVLGHQADTVKACLAHVSDIRFVHPESCSSPVEGALHGLQFLDLESAIVCHGDLVTTEAKIRTICEFATANPGEFGMLVSNPAKRTGDLVAVETRPDGVVLALGQSHAPFLPRVAGVFLGPREHFATHAAATLDGAREAKGDSERAEADLWRVFDRIVKSKRDVQTLYNRDFLVDVDMAWQLGEANHLAVQELFSSLEENRIHPGATVDDSAYVAANAKIWLEEGAEIGRRCDVQGNLYMQKRGQMVNGTITRNNVVIGEGTKAENYGLILANSVLGANCNFGFNSAFLGYAFDGVSMRHEAQVCAILGRKVNVAGGVLTGNFRFDHKNAKHRGKPDSLDSGSFGNMTIIGDETQIGSGVVFHPGMRVGYQSCIGPGSIITKDVPEETRTIAPQNLVYRPWKADRWHVESLEGKSE